MATPIMLGGLASYDKVRDVRGIVDEGELGIYVNLARLVDQVLRDARILSTLMTRILGLLGKPRNWEPAEGKGIRKDTAQRIAEELESLFPQMAPHAALVELFVWGLMLGVGFARIVEDDDPWRLEVWHPWALEWNEFERKYYLQTRDDVRMPIDPDGKGGFRSSDGTRWVLFTPFGFENGGRRGLVRALAELYLERRWIHRDRARYSEKHGKPTTVGIAPEDSEKPDRDQFKKDLTVGDEPTVVVRQGPDGRKWDVKLVEAMGKSHELFEGALQQLDGETATLLLGQKQTTDGQAGLGSNDQAGEPVRLDISKADAESFTDFIRPQFVKPYCEWAYGNPDLAPWLCIHVDPPEDKLAKAQELKAFVDSLVAAKAAALPLDEPALFDKFDQPMMSEAEQQAKAEQAAQAQAQMQQPTNQNGAANGAYGGA